MANTWLVMLKAQYLQYGPSGKTNVAVVHVTADTEAQAVAKARELAASCDSAEPRFRDPAKWQLLSVVQAPYSDGVLALYEETY